MTDTVGRIKELLFDAETRELAELSQRIDRIGAAGDELHRRLEALLERTGTKERLESSVAEVLDGALRKAEVERHNEMASAVAPLVVRTVKTEIGNSKDELVEALYPMTGRMVKAYIASAMKDLANDINRRLESNPLMLRLKSIATGKSMAELAMAETQRLVVEELYLIRRGTGELVARWPEAGPERDSGRDHVMSGVLTAINEFSSEALGDEASGLRQIDLGERQIYLRASPVYLLAAKCSGTAAQPVEAVIDEAFLSAIERINDLPGGIDPADAASKSRLLPSLSDDVGRRLEAKHEELGGDVRAFTPLKLVAWIIGLPLLAWLAWTLYAHYRTEHVRSIATAELTSYAELKGYPVKLSVESMGLSLSVGGLAPSARAREGIIARLRTALPGVEIADQMAVLPSGLAEVEPLIAGVRGEVQGLAPEVSRVAGDVKGLEPEVDKMRGAIAGLEPRIDDIRNTVAGLSVSARLRAVERALRKLEQAQALELQLEGLIEGGPARATVLGARKTLSDAVGILLPFRSRGRALAATAKEWGALIELSGRISTTSGELSGLLLKAPPAAVALPSGKETGTSSVDDDAETLADEAERLGTILVAAVQALAVKKSLPQPVIAEREPSVRERLEAWTRANAVFFANDTEYRDPARTEETLAALARLLGESTLIVRIVGYTDDKGAQSSNSSLSLARAQKVVGDLTSLGVPASRLVAVGRLDGLDISSITGETSPNRRAEFEVGFEGELAP